MKSAFLNSRLFSNEIRKRIIFTLILTLFSPFYIGSDDAKAVDCSPTQTRSGNTIILSFTSVTTCDWTVPAGVTSLRYLIVGGGGAGGTGRGGGGGAGGLIRGNVAVSSNQSLSIKVGAGGTGSSTPGSNTNGDTSSITTLSLTAPGGGRGGSHRPAFASNDSIENGATGGSGGGGSINYQTYTNSGGGSGGGSVLGNSGAGSSTLACTSRNDANRNTGGGGGAGGAGILGCNSPQDTNTGTAPTGGAGIADTITGTSVTYAGGGGGAGGRGWNDPTCEAGYYTAGAGAGGSGGGGTGQGCAAAPSNLNGTANTGGGGGGGTAAAGGNGGSGIVIISYASTTPTYGGSCTTGSVTQTFDTSTGAQVEIFNVADSVTSASCSFVVPNNVVAVDYLVVGGGGGGASGGGGAGGVLTNREVRDETGTAVLSGKGRRSALSVYSGDTISVTVGVGGAGGWGGSYKAGYYSGCPSSGTGSFTANNSRNNMSGLTPTRASNGVDSKFGSIKALGGGAGGGISNISGCAGTFGSGGNSGGSGGGTGFDAGSSTGTSAAVSSVVGANSNGNAGGGSIGTGYSAGGGGGGAGQAGIAAQGNQSHTGGKGGDGIKTDILNTGDFSVEYGCGGGGGTNDNSDVRTAAYAGDAGCSTSGKGSDFGPTYTGDSTTAVPSGISCTTGNTKYSCFTGTLVTDGFGGGGGGTDAEGINAGRGGAGIVIISYFVNNSACPNNGVNATSTRPLACNFTVSIRAGRDTVTVDPRGNPYSYSDTPTTTARLTIGVDSITITVSGSLFTISAPDVNNPLRGGTYPALYSLTTTGTDTSSAYININVTDPAQHTPTRVGINPWVTSMKVPSIVFGTINAVLVCITPRANNAAGYGNLPTVTMSSVASNALRTDLANGGIKLEGTVDSITANASNFRIVKNSSDRRLLPGSAERVFDVNVSNTATGGNGSCTGGSESTLTIYRLGFSQKNTKNVPLTNGKQP